MQGGSPVGHLHHSGLGVGGAHARRGRVLGRGGRFAAIARGRVVLAPALGGLGNLRRRHRGDLVHRGNGLRKSLFALAGSSLLGGLLAPRTGSGIVGQFLFECRDLRLSELVQMLQLLAPPEAARYVVRI